MTAKRCSVSYYLGFRTMMYPTLLAICVSVYCTEIVLGCNNHDRLVKDLSKNYVKSVEPDNLTVRFGLAIQCARYEKINGELSTHAWERYFWNDERLSWDPKDYDGIKVIRLPVETIWRPDLKLYNSMKSAEDRDHTNAVVTSNGSVIWIPTVVYKTLCSNDDGSYNCQIKIGSWTYDSFLLDLKLDSTGVDLSNYYNSTCPLLVGRANSDVKTTIYPCCKEPYSSIEINLNLRPRFS